MNVNIQTVHFDAYADLRSYIEKKLDKLEQFREKMKIRKVDVYLQLNKLSSGLKEKTAGIRIRIPGGKEIYVKTTSLLFEESFDNALDSVVEQLVRIKHKVKRPKAKIAKWLRKYHIAA